MDNKKKNTPFLPLTNTMLSLNVTGVTTASGG